MSNNKTYETFSNQAVATNYPAVEPPSILQRYGSGHLDQDIFGISVSRLPNKQQMAFVRKAILITFCQFCTVSTMIVFIVRICPLIKWLKESTWTWWIPLIPTFSIAILVLWQLYAQYFHLSTSTRITLLAIYTFLMAIVISNIVAKLIYEEGILVIFMSVFGMSCCLLYTLQKRFHFKGAFPLFCSLATICLSSPWLRYLYDMDPLQILFPIAASSIICVYIILELYYIMKNFTQDDYLLANVCLFIDIIYPIRFIHHFCELTDNMNAFPDILYPGDALE